MTYPLYIFFGLAPSIIWLLFYLRKDVHPESNRMVLKIFFLGMLAAIPAAILELGIFSEISKLNLPPILVSVFYIFIGIALVEEILKYLVVKGRVLNNPEFDEPLDAMLYMIIAALGFSGLENIFILFGLGPFQLFETFLVSVLRFVGATFLHALCSGTIGYFLALSFFETKRRQNLIISGFFIAILLHGFYNLSIMKIEGNARFIVPVMILVGLSLFVSFGFKRLKELKSICLFSKN